MCRKLVSTTYYVSSWSLLSWCYGKCLTHRCEFVGFDTVSDSIEARVARSMDVVSEILLSSITIVLLCTNNILKGSVVFGCSLLCVWLTTASAVLLYAHCGGFSTKTLLPGIYVGVSCTRISWSALYLAWTLCICELVFAHNACILCWKRLCDACRGVSLVFALDAIVIALDSGGLVEWLLRTELYREVFVLPRTYVLNAYDDGCKLKSQFLWWSAKNCRNCLTIVWCTAWPIRLYVDGMQELLGFEIKSSADEIKEFIYEPWPIVHY